MYYNGSMLKTRARAIIAASEPKPLYAALIFVGVSLLLSILSSRLIGTSLTVGEYERLMEIIEAGNVEYAISYLQRFRPSGGEYLINLAIEIVSPIWAAGFAIFLLNTVRAREASYGNLLDGFGIWGKVIVLSLLQGIFIALWSMLLLVPGIIAAYRYRQAIYILIDDPMKRPLDCIRESKQMMAGHKAELFMLDLSFIGWSLLTLLPLLGWAAQVWLSVYSGSCYAMYYDQLRRTAWDIPHASGDGTYM